MSFDERRRKITTYTTTTTRSGFGSSSNRSALGYWIPLALTVTAATVGLAAWIWSERSDDDETELSDSDDHYYGTTGPVPGPGGAGAEFAAGAAMAGGAAAGYAMSGGLPPGPGPAGFQGGQPGPGMGQPPAAGGFQGGPLPGPTGFQDNRAMSTGVEERSNINVNVQQDNSFYSRMTNALGFGYNNPATYNEQGFQPQPPVQDQQTWIGKGMATAAAGAAAAGAVVGSAVKSLRESGEETFSDQEQWSEEADKPERSSPKKGIRRTGTAEEFYSGAVEVPRRISVGGKLGRRKKIAIVVSSVPTTGSDNADVGIHASILAHLPEHVNPDKTSIFVLIYAPDLSVHPLSAAAASNQPAPGSTSIRAQQPEQRSSSRHSTSGQSTTSSYANIMTPGPDGQTPAQTPGDFPMDPSSTDPGILTSVSPRPMESSSVLPTRAVDNDTSALYKTLHNQALALVDRDTMIIPFTTSTGHKHILRSIGPEVVYIQESLCGRDGDMVADLKGWVKQVVIVIGDEGGLGGLVDTDTENEDEKGRGRTGRTGTQWWAREEVTGLGRGVGVVEALRVGEDWRRRVGEED